MKPYPEDEALSRATARAVRGALAEDRVADDVTTNATVPSEVTCRAEILCRGAAVLAGAAVADAAFSEVDGALSRDWRRLDGDVLEPGERVASITGAAGAVLRAERVALNFLMRLSGIATLTALFVEAVRGTGAEILDTRKTTPGLRLLEKRAVLAGGGVNHRPDLASMALIKENHIAAAGGIEAAVRLVRENAPGVEVEVEVENLEELGIVLGLGIERVLLDNFSNEEIEGAVALSGERGKRPYLEASGGFDLERARRVARLGVDGISVGALTHSAPAADFSLLFERTGG